MAAADRHRQDALTEMFAGQGFERAEAIVRARLVYRSQVGRYAVGTEEPISTRLGHLPHYLRARTGTTPTRANIAAFEAVLADIPPSTPVS
ncbi:MAG: hypothetical protein GY713_12610 [Actinomycetia bacterium]|nr:hypothetical protein [Actinomycetes bacterium]MCP4222928.1 hypothetical protein [Actinomycetes bacterium]MCP5035545.1 hypothetical protein [Actinomycetes bacterium]